MHLVEMSCTSTQMRDIVRTLTAASKRLRAELSSRQVLSDPVQGTKIDIVIRSHFLRILQSMFTTSVPDPPRLGWPMPTCASCSRDGRAE